MSGPILFANGDSETITNAVYALGMNKAMFPVQENLTQSQMTEE